MRPEPITRAEAAAALDRAVEQVRLNPPIGCGDLYAGEAWAMMGSLVRNYAAPLREGGGLLLHGTYSKKSPYNTCTPEGVDECVSWGDYFCMEALTRLVGDWAPYW